MARRRSESSESAAAGGRQRQARTEAARLPAFIYGVVQDERAKPVARARIWLREERCTISLSRV